MARVRRLTVFLVVGVGLVGCSADEPNPSQVVSAVLDPEHQQIELPLDEFVLSEREAKLVGHVNAQRLAGCLQERGLPYPELERDWRSEALTHNRLFGPWNLDWVAQHGYDYPASPETQAVIDAAANLPAEYGLALQECMESTELWPLITLYDEPNLAMRGAMESYTSAQSSGDWATAVEEWRGCIRDKGHSVEDAPDVFVPDLPAGQEARIRVAIADVECKEEVSLVQRLADVVAAEQLEFIEANDAALEQLKADKDDVLAEARAELNSSE